MQVRLIIILVFFFLNTINCLNKQKDCKCKILPKSKIVGGKVAHHLAYPWITSLSQLEDDTPDMYKRLVHDNLKIMFHSCGGSIINENWILTAAHCIPENMHETLHAGYGNDNDLIKIFNSGRIEAIKIIQNPNFDGNSDVKQLHDDIALLKLKEPITFSKEIKPACFLNNHVELYSGALVIAGWGLTNIFKVKINTKESSESHLSINLKEMFLVDQSDTFKDCHLNKNIICAKGIEKEESSCKGDSGGPIHYDKNGKSYVVGIASYSAETYIKDDYFYSCVGTTAFTRVSSYLDWIKKYVGEEICDFEI